MDIFIKSTLAFLFFFGILIFLKQRKITKQNKIEFSDKLNKTINMNRSK